jgi:hypothetical protein
VLNAKQHARAGRCQVTYTSWKAAELANAVQSRTKRSMGYFVQQTRLPVCGQGKQLQEEQQQQQQLTCQAGKRDSSYCGSSKKTPTPKRHKHWLEPKYNKPYTRFWASGYAGG